MSRKRLWEAYYCRRVMPQDRSRGPEEGYPTAVSGELQDHELGRKRREVYRLHPRDADDVSHGLTGRTIQGLSPQTP